jgi:hypothetical protein
MHPHRAMLGSRYRTNIATRPRHSTKQKLGGGDCGSRRDASRREVLHEGFTAAQSAHLCDEVVKVPALLP